MTGLAATLVFVDQFREAGFARIQSDAATTEFLRIQLQQLHCETEAAV